MMLVCVLLLAFAQVSASSLLLHNITKREAQTKCPSCQASDLCAPKFEMIKGHTACLTKSSVAKPIAMTEAERIEIVNYHNLLRASVVPPAADMLQLKWDSEVEMLARRWADACSGYADNSFRHDTIRYIPGRISVGQNFAWGTIYPNFTKATDGWFKEKDDYAKYLGQQLNQFPADKQIGHYTQIVWASSRLIGCAATLCDNKPFYVCNYAPGGNVTPFTSPYKIATTAGESCKTRTDKGLCDCGDLVCENDIDVNTTSCTCGCKYDIQASPTCSLDCSKPAGYFCGTQAGFMQTDCSQFYMLAACPHVCGICPCAESKHKSKMCGNGSSNNRVGHVFVAVSVVLGCALAF